MLHYVRLTTPERDLISDLLEGDRSRLLLEIARTAHRQMKAGLCAQEELLAEVLHKLQADGGPRE